MDEGHSVKDEIILFFEGASLNMKHISGLFKIGKLLLQPSGAASRGRSIIEPGG